MASTYFSSSIAIHTSFLVYARGYLNAHQAGSIPDPWLCVYVHIAYPIAGNFG